MSNDDIESGPWKCTKCNIIFTDKKKMFKHWNETGYYELDNPDAPGIEGTKGTTWLHKIVDADGDDIMYPKKRYN